MQRRYIPRFRFRADICHPLPVSANLAKICVVDPDRAVRERLEALLTTASTEVAAFDSAEALLGVVDETGISLLVAEMTLPDMDGLTLLEELQRRGLSVPTIFLTTGTDVGSAVSAMRAGAIDFIEKPVVGPLLFARVKRALGLDT